MATKNYRADALTPEQEIAAAIARYAHRGSGQRVLEVEAVAYLERQAANALKPRWYPRRKAGDQPAQPDRSTLFTYRVPARRA